MTIENVLDSHPKVPSGLQEENVPLSSRIFVSAADGFVNLMQGVISAALSFYFVKNRGMDEGLAGLVWILFGIWNAINDPLYGYIGRRIPYIRYGAPLIAIAYIACWIHWPGDGNDTILFIQLLLTLFFYDTFYTAVASALYVMPFEMAVSNKARGSLLVWTILCYRYGFSNGSNTDD